MFPISRRLFDLFFMILSCLIFSTFCNTASSDLSHVTLLGLLCFFMLHDLVIKMLVCLVLTPSCCPTPPSLVMSSGFMSSISFHTIWVTWVSLWWYASWSSLPHATLPDALALPSSCCFASSYTKSRYSAWSCFVMILCLVFSTSCYGDCPSHVMVCCFM
jgi:hypothetical protein